MAEYFNGKLLDENEIHKEISISVGTNKTAMVDEEIIPLVQALNNHENFVTSESCQGSMANKKKAYVTFLYDGIPKNESVFLHEFAHTICPYLQDSEMLSLMWASPCGTVPMIMICTYPTPGNIKSLSVLVSEVLKSIHP